MIFGIKSFITHIDLMEGKKFYPRLLVVGHIIDQCPIHIKKECFFIKTIEERINFKSIKN